MNIADEIGVCALLEQTAEECAELAQAALKLSRKMRNENPTPAISFVLRDKLTEEFADVANCMEELLKANVVYEEEANYIAESKMKRWYERIAENK